MRNICWIVIFILLGCENKTKDKIIVGIQPYAEFPITKTDIIAATIQDFYGYKTTILPNKPHDTNTFINVKSPRYRADKIIKLQKEELPDSLDFIIGLTENSKIFI